MALLLPASSLADNIEQDGISYSISGDTAMVIPGRFPYSGDVAIPTSISCGNTSYTVTAIGHSAFRDCSELKSISIPASVKTIKEHAFAGCTGLDSVAISDLANWCSIDFESNAANPCYHAHHLFLNGQEIIELVVPDSATIVNSFAFTGCASLNSVSIPSTVTDIGLSAFTGCSSLSTITVASDNPSYDSRDNCNAIIWTASGTLIAGCKNTVIPSTVTAIGGWAFRDCTGLTGIHIPSEVTEIGMEAFYGCTSLLDVNIPSKVTYIGYQAFYGCSELREIAIPRSVRAICSSAFEYCPSITSMTVAQGNPRYDSREGCNAIIETGENTLIAGCKNTVIPTSVTAIGDYAFSGNSSLARIDIPSSVTSVGDYAFRGCSALRQAVLPDGVKSIGASAFFDCSLLNQVNIPASVENIGSFAFEHCPAVFSMTVDADNPVYDSRDSCNAIIETATGTLIAGCMNTVIPATVTAIGDNAFSGCFMLTRLSIPKSVKTIGHYAFTDCSSLAVIDIPSTITAIGDAAFGGCSALTGIDLPKSVTSIGDYEFYRCTQLANVKIPNSVTSIGTGAFRGCFALTEIAIPKSVTRIGTSAFSACPMLARMTVASGNPNYDSRNGCNAIIETATGTLIAGCQNTVIPDDVTSIGYAAFDGCSTLEAITLPRSISTIGKKAFHDCLVLKDVTSLITDPSTAIIAHDAFKLTSGDYTDRTLHVPADAVPAYQSAPVWSEFFPTILPIQ